MQIDLPDEPLLQELQTALNESRELRITYFNPARSESAQRTVRVGKIYSEYGHWYVLADDDKSGAMRNFRVDRIREIQRTGKTYDQADVARAPTSKATSGSGRAWRPSRCACAVTRRGCRRRIRSCRARRTATGRSTWCCA